MRGGGEEGGRRSTGLVTGAAGAVCTEYECINEWNEFIPTLGYRYPSYLRLVSIKSMHALLLLIHF